MTQDGNSSSLSFLPGNSAGSSAAALYARETAGFEVRLAKTVDLLREAVATHGAGVIQSTSLGAEDMVITDLIARHELVIDVATLDTGKLHVETLALIPQIESRLGLQVAVFKPAEEQVVHFVRTNGERAMYESLALRKACCALRKLEPLSRMLAGRTAWITGLRREQSSNRAEVPFSEPDGQGRTKLNVLAEWTWADVWHYIEKNDVPYNALHDQFMPSIGCEPCTRAIAVGEDFRAGRWWWENDGAKECGLHKSHSPAQAGDSQGEADGPSVSVQGHIVAADVSRNQNENAKECGLHKARSNEELKTGVSA